MMLKKLAQIIVIILMILQGLWVRCKLIIQNTPEFPNIIVTFGLMSLALGILKWSKETSSN